MSQDRKQETGSRVNVIFVWRRKSTFTCSHVKLIKHHVHIFSRSSGCALLSFTSSTGLQTERYNKQEAGEPRGLTKQTGNSTSTNRKQHINRVPNYEDLLCCWWSLVEATVSNGVTGRIFQSRCFIKAVGLASEQTFRNDEAHLFTSHSLHFNIWHTLQ